VSFRCMVCGHEGEVLVRPNVTLDIVDNYGGVLPEPENDDRELFNMTIDALAIRLTEAIFERDQIAARRNTLVERYEHFREQMQTQMKLTSRIREVLYPGGDVDHEWSTYELDEIARLLEVGIGKDKVIPKSVQDEIDRHVEQGCPCGDFVTAILDNDLQEAFQRADDHNLAYMKEIVTYMYAHTPAACQGSKLKRRAWQSHQGLASLPIPPADKEVQDEEVEGNEEQMPRAYTAEELRDELLNYMKARASYWANVKSEEETIERRIKSAMFSVLSFLDGTASAGLCPFDLVARPHLEDRQHYMKSGKNWVEDGTTLSFMLHEHWHRSGKAK